MRNRSSRESILETACELFYARGYNDTSLEDIAKRCSVTKQAITYHFGSKAGLGREVSHRYSVRLKKSFTATVTAQAGETDHLTMSAAYILWFSGFYRRDAKAFRFFEEFVFPDPIFEDIVKSEENEYYTTFGIKDPDAEMDTSMMLRNISTFYAGKGLLHRYGKRSIDCPEEEFARFLFMNYFSPFIADRKLLERIHAAAADILRKVRIRILPCYQVG